MRDDIAAEYDEDPKDGDRCACPLCGEDSRRSNFVDLICSTCETNLEGDKQEDSE